MCVCVCVRVSAAGVTRPSNESEVRHKPVSRARSGRSGRGSSARLAW